MNASGGFAGRRQTHRLADCVEVTHVTQVTVAENPGTPDSTPKASIEYTLRIKPDRRRGARTYSGSDRRHRSSAQTSR